MPIYEYKCGGCGEVESHLLPISRRNEICEVPCSKCGGEVKMKIGAPSIVSGVRVTDKRPDGWRDVLGNIKKTAGKTSTIET